MYLTKFPNTSRLVKNALLLNASFFTIPFSVFRNVVKYSLLCLIYYLPYLHVCINKLYIKFHTYIIWVPKIKLAPVISITVNRVCF